MKLPLENKHVERILSLIIIMYGLRLEFSAQTLRSLHFVLLQALFDSHISVIESSSSANSLSVIVTRSDLS